MDHTSEFIPQGEVYVSKASHDRLLMSHSPLRTGCAATLICLFSLLSPREFGFCLGLRLKDPPDGAACFSLSSRFKEERMSDSKRLFGKCAEIIKREIKEQPGRSILFC